MNYMDDKETNMTKNEKLTVIAYYMSEYEKDAMEYLGFKTLTSMYEEVSKIFGNYNSFLRRKVNEFDPYTSSTRTGYHKEMPHNVQRVLEEYSLKSKEEVRNIVMAFIREYEEKVDDIIADSQYVDRVNMADVTTVKKKYQDKPCEVKDIKISNIKTYDRNINVALNALCNANYMCEVDNKHITFVRKSNGKSYMEPHHLVPLKYQYMFDVSLDVENNIVSLCSNCHNRLHYGIDIDEILKPLYTNRKILLEKAGINITYEQLQKLY